MTMINGRYRLMKKVERYSSPLQSTRVHTCGSFQGVKNCSRNKRKTNNSEERAKGRAVVVGGEFVLHSSNSGCEFSPTNREIALKWTPRPRSNCSRTVRRGVTTNGRALSSWSPDISRCADSRPCESGPAPPSPDHNLPARPLFWDYWLGSGTGARRDRIKFARPVRNLVNLAANRAWRWLRPCRVLPPAICKRGFSPRDRCRVLPAACKPARRCLPRRFAAAPRAIDFHNRTGATRTRRR